MTILRLPVTREWFDKIWEGEKTEDYREIKPYWESRLVTGISAYSGYTHVLIVNGYGKDRPSMLFEYAGLRITEEDEHTDLGVGRFYAIQLGDIVEHDNVTYTTEYFVAGKEWHCNAYDWIQEGAIELSELDWGDKKRLVLVCRSEGKILRGDRYIKIYGSCGIRKRWIYRALIPAHEINVNNDVYVDGC